MLHPGVSTTFPLSYKLGTMHVWDESTASRGAHEIASRLMKYLQKHKGKDSVIARSNCCGG